MNTHGEKSREFKFKIMEMHYKNNIPVKVLAEKFCVPEGTIYTWRSEYSKYGEDAFVGCGRQRPEDAAIRKLKKENENLKMQVELLKKVAAYQALKESVKK